MFSVNLCLETFSLTVDWPLCQVTCRSREATTIFYWSSLLTALLTGSQYQRKCLVFWKAFVLMILQMSSWDEWEVWSVLSHQSEDFHKVFNRQNLSLNLMQSAGCNGMRLKLDRREKGVRGGGGHLSLSPLLQISGDTQQIWRSLGECQAGCIMRGLTTIIYLPVHCPPPSYRVTHTDDLDISMRTERISLVCFLCVRPTVFDMFDVDQVEGSACSWICRVFIKLSVTQTDLPAY